MSVNKELPHVVVLPEDDANRQIALGFMLHVSNPRQTRIRGAAGGWCAVTEKFIKDEVSYMEKWPKCHMLLLIDFDFREDRLAAVKRRIPTSLVERVFVLGASSEPENLKKETKSSYEKIGELLARDCLEQTLKLWNNDMLSHNAAELGRLRKSVRPILFDA